MNDDIKIGGVYKIQDHLQQFVIVVVISIGKLDGVEYCICRVLNTRDIILFNKLFFLHTAKFLNVNNK